MADKKSMAELLAELKPIVSRELNDAMDNDYNSMRNVLKRMKKESNQDGEGKENGSFIY